MVDHLKEYAEAKYTDEEFEILSAKYDHARPFTKESLLYRELFEEYYPGQSEMIADFWMPNKEWEGCDVNDPSARVLSNYADDHIKMIEILRTDRTGTMGQIVTAAGSMHPHTAVGQFPSMITQDSGRIHLYLVFQSFFLYESTHHFFFRKNPEHIIHIQR